MPVHYGRQLVSVGGSRQLLPLIVGEAGTVVLACVQCPECMGVLIREVSWLVRCVGVLIGEVS